MTFFRGFIVMFLIFCSNGAFAGWMSNACNNAKGVVNKVGDTLKSSATVGNVLKALKDNGYNPSNVVNAQIASAVFDQTTGSVSIGGSFDIPGVPNSKCGFRIKYNPETKKFDQSEIEIEGKAIPIDPANLDATLDAAIQHSMDWIPNFGAAERLIESDYDDIFARLESQYGKGNVYLASEQFVSWACPTTVGNDVLKEIVSAGSATDVIIDGVKQQAEKELERVADWLKMKALNSLDPVTIAGQILKGDKPDKILPSLSLRWQNIEYKSHVRILQQDLNPTQVAETHWGFVLIWHDPNNPVSNSRLQTTNSYTTRNGDIEPLDVKWTLGVGVQYTTLGCRIVVIPKNSAAARAGLEFGDTITSVDGDPVGNIDKMHWVLWRVLNKTMTGKVTLVVQADDGAVRVVNVMADRLH